ncbi:DUF1289 domain-containing protein [Hirschia baltica]|uniref:DUF1289 domain-containing protein n=1 Tax=Hirschia baltica TaxID=2724 RepID=UPI0038991CAE
MIQSPCKNICELDSSHTKCISCHRTLIEIENWSLMTQQERRDILVKLPDRAEIFLQSKSENANGQELK